MTELLELSQLNITGKALAAATQYSLVYPGAVYTSGRRTIDEQAWAMASNIIRNHKWVEQTYVHSAPALACQQWVDTATQPLIEKQIASALTWILAGFEDTSLASLSLHLSGNAFDVLPLAGPQGAASIALLQSMARIYSGKFLQREGGLIRWHWEAHG